MSIVYTADVFCDGEDCSQWTHGVTGAKPPLKWEARLQARLQARNERWTHIRGKDYCPMCDKKRLLSLLPESAA